MTGGVSRDASQQTVGRLRVSSEDGMAPKFGTSGLRGRVAALTPDLIGAYVSAFVEACPVGGTLYIGRDLRPSSPRIAKDVSDAARRAGLQVIDCGEVPTPALALASMTAGSAAVMITGSHIPTDRNGLKFYTPAGEISKVDEAAISGKIFGATRNLVGPKPITDAGVGPRYMRRYTQAFAADTLLGLRIGVYTHSAVGRDLLMMILRDLGAEVTELGRSDHFVPVDTEAVDAATAANLRVWAKDFDAIVSTDGDGDRPLVADERGRIIPGDILGQIAAEALGAEIVVTPVSSNSGVEAKPFHRVIRSRIGSPHVIAGMAGQTKAVGYEANGGFLLGFAASMTQGNIAPLMTRDSLLPIILSLMMAKGQGLAATAAAEPPRFTATGRLQDIPSEQAISFIARLLVDNTARKEFLSALGGAEASIDTTDGLRITLDDGRILHIRPSGNAPELRLYIEAGTPNAAATLLQSTLSIWNAESAFY